LKIYRLKKLLKLNLGQFNEIMTSYIAPNKDNIFPKYEEQAAENFANKLIYCMHITWLSEDKKWTKLN